MDITDEIPSSIISALVENLSQAVQLCTTTKNVWNKS